MSRPIAKVRVPGRGRPDLPLDRTPGSRRRPTTSRRAATTRAGRGTPGRAEGRRPGARGRGAGDRARSASPRGDEREVDAIIAATERGHRPDRGGPGRRARRAAAGAARGGPAGARVRVGRVRAEVGSRGWLAHRPPAGIDRRARRLRPATSPTRRAPPRRPGSTSSGRSSSFAARSPRRLSWAPSRRRSGSAPGSPGGSRAARSSGLGARHRRGHRRALPARARAGVRRLNETWHGVAYGRPAPHLRESVEAVRLIIQSARRRGARSATGAPTTTSTSRAGCVRTPSPPASRCRSTRPRCSEGMARVAGDVADGMIGHPMCSLRWFDEVLVTNFELGLDRSDRSRADLDFVPTVCCAIDDDEAPRSTPPGARSASTPPCARTCRCGRCTASAMPPRPSATRSARGDLAAACRGHIPDEMVDTFTRGGAGGQGCASGSSTVAARGDGLWLTPPTYFLAPEQLAAYQSRIRRGVRPGARVAA